MSLINVFLNSQLYAGLPYSMRRRIKDWVMDEQYTLKWAEEYSQTPNNFTVEKVGAISGGGAFPLLPYLDKYLESHTPSFIMQIGYSSGKEIAYLAKNYPNKRFVGYDLHDNVAIAARNRHPLENLLFKAGRAEEIDIPYGSVVFFCGTMQYLQPEELAIFLKRFPRHAVLMIEEGVIKGCPKTKYRSNFAWSYDYEAHLKEYGFEVELCTKTYPFPNEKDRPDHVFVVARKE